MIQNRVYQHLRLMGYQDRSAKRFARCVDRWIHQSGMEWTCNRLKELKTCFRTKLATGNYRVPLGWATRHSRQGHAIFKDSFVHYVMSLPTNIPENLRKIEGFLRVPTLLELTEVSSSQRQKLEEAVTSPPSIDLTSLMAWCKEENLLKLRQVKDRSDLVKIRTVGDNTPALPLLLGVNNKRSPTFKVNHKGKVTIGKSAKRREAAAGAWLEYFQSDNQANAFWVSNPEFVARKLLGVEYYPVSYYAERTDDNPVGRLTALQEGSCKVRWVANPLLAFQALGEPLKVKLQEFTNLCYPEVRVIDQDDGRDTVADWLNNSLVVWSYDCTSFTDRFPVCLQRDVLHSLEETGVVDKVDTELFELVVSKSWTSDVLGQDVKWAVGQPLGFGPSFPLATLTHAVILDNLDVNHSGNWRIVGDDVVIADESLATNYTNFMQKAGVEINLQKSLVSDTYAEFLGKLITKWGVVPSMKVKLLVGRDRIVDNMLFYGESCLQLLDLEEIRDGAGVFSPALLGGADWRLEGISYSVWLSLLRTKDMSEALRNKVLREAIPREKLYSRDATEAMLNLRAKLCDINTLPLSQSEWETGTTVDVKVNGFTNIPVGYAGVQDPNPSVYKETQWVELIDQEMIRKNHFKAASEWFVEQTYGYAINQSEKPFTGQSVSYRSITSDKVNRKSPNFFSQRGIKSYLKGQEGAFIPQRTREILEAVGNVQSTKGETHGQVRLEDERARPGERLPAKRRKPRRPGRQSQFAKSD